MLVYGVIGEVSQVWVVVELVRWTEGFVFLIGWGGVLAAGGSDLVVCVGSNSFRHLEMFLLLLVLGYCIVGVPWSSGFWLG